MDDCGGRRSVDELEAYAVQLSEQLARLELGGGTPEVLEALRAELERVEDALIDVGYEQGSSSILKPVVESDESDSSTPPPSSDEESQERSAVDPETNTRPSLSEPVVKTRTKLDVPAGSPVEVKAQSCVLTEESAKPQTYRNSALQARVNEAMQRTQQKLQERQEKLEALDAKSSAMHAEAQDFQTSAARLRRKMERSAGKFP